MRGKEEGEEKEMVLLMITLNGDDREQVTQPWPAGLKPAGYVEWGLGFSSGTTLRSLVRVQMEGGIEWPIH